MTKWMIVVLTGLTLMGGIALAQDDARVLAQIEPWLDEVEIYRAATDALQGEWQAGSSEAAPHTELYVQAGAHFVMATQETSADIREMSPGNDAACILRGISLDVTERLNALGDAAGSAAHVEVLRGIGRLLYEGLLIFGREEEARLFFSAPIRVAYVKKSEKASSAAGASEECDEAQNPGKAP